jgi:hypothetical protein
VNRLVPPLLLLVACSEYDLGVNPDSLGIPLECNLDTIFPDDVQAIDSCADVPGGFVPIVEWGAGDGESCRGVPAVGDLDGDGRAEIVANFTAGFLPGAAGAIVALEGDGTERWRVADASLGFATGLTLADVDEDGHPEIFGVKGYGIQMPPPAGSATYSVVRYDWEGNFVWESERFTYLDFDYATGVIVSDMDKDGSAEVVAGRVILNEDGSTRGRGDKTHGSWGEMPNILGPDPVTEGSVVAVADLDLDGIEEVITGNTWYTPDGAVKWHDSTQPDGMVAIANIDADPQGEMVVSSFNAIRVVDHDGHVLWGPLEIPGANIVSPVAIADVDHDGSPEIFAAGGNALVAFRADGSQLWQAEAIDESGATGPSVFDFEGDGELDIVYIDEQNMSVFEGKTGVMKFFNPEHASDTMMDYPVIADVDSDGQAEIVVAHANFTRALSVYGDQNESWGPARRVWNQHSYSINNINDDLTLPVEGLQGFETHNTWHSATDTRFLDGTLKELSAELLETCEVDCEDGVLYVVGRVQNRAADPVLEDIPVALYALVDGIPQLVGQEVAGGPTPPASTGAPFAFRVAADIAAQATELRLVVDDDGSGLGVHFECDETDNTAVLAGPFCGAP